MFIQQCENTRNAEGLSKSISFVDSQEQVSSLVVVIYEGSLSQLQLNSDTTVRNVRTYTSNTLE